MGDRLEEVGRTTTQRVVDLVGKEKHCRVVNSGARRLVKQLFKEHGDAEATKRAQRAIGHEVEKLCRGATPEGRSIVILTGAAATVVYGIIKWDELEPQIAKSLREATIPISIPLRKIGRPRDELTLSPGIQRLEIEFSTELRNGRLSIHGGYDFERGNHEVGFRYKLFEW